MVFDFLRRETNEAQPEARKASATGPLVAHLSSGRVAWSARDSVSLTRSGFAGNPVGFRAVKLIAEAVAALPLVLQDSQQRYAEHPVLALMTAPNTAQGRAEFLEALVGQILLSGEGCGGHRRLAA
jgi:phage portal protein BeeE